MPRHLNVRKRKIRKNLDKLFNTKGTDINKERLFECEKKDVPCPFPVQTYVFIIESFFFLRPKKIHFYVWKHSNLFIEPRAKSLDK